MAEVNETIHHIRAKGTLFEVEDQQARQSAGSTTAEKVIYEVKDPGTETEEVVSVKDKIEEVEDEIPKDFLSKAPDILLTNRQVLNLNKNNSSLNNYYGEYLKNDIFCGSNNYLEHDGNETNVLIGSNIHSLVLAPAVIISNRSPEGYVKIKRGDLSKLDSSRFCKVWAAEESYPIDETKRRDWEYPKILWLDITNTYLHSETDLYKALIGLTIVIDKSSITADNVYTPYTGDDGQPDDFLYNYTYGTIQNVLEIDSTNNNKVKVYTGQASNFHYMKFPKNESEAFNCAIIGPYSYINDMMGHNVINTADETLVLGSPNSLHDNSHWGPCIVCGGNNRTARANATIFGDNNVVSYYPPDDDDPGYDKQTVAGHYPSFATNRFIIGNNNSWGTENYNDLFIIAGGAGSYKSGRNWYYGRENIFRVTADGETYAKGEYHTTGADYAEYFEWLDGNPNKEDRVGFFVTTNGKKIIKANSNDYILGVVSGLPAMIGNSDNDWMGKWIHDEFGRFVLEEVEKERDEIEKYIDEDKKEKERTIKVKYKEFIIKENPDYDPSKPYIPRKDRPEWSAVGMMGVLAVRDDGSCLVNGFCDPADGGIATAGTKYRVIERVSENVVKIIFK